MGDVSVGILEGCPVMEIAIQCLVELCVMHCSGLASASFDVSSYPEEVGGDFHWSRTWRGEVCSKISTQMGREKIAVAIAM
eukprot:4326162-Ditylum_brightwellii.AAC.1